MNRNQIKQGGGAVQSRLPKSKKEEQEFSVAKDIVICPDCNAVYYHKSWHHALEGYDQLSEDKDLQFSVCPACQMIKEKKYEGQVIIKNVSEKEKKELLNLIKNTAERALKRDVLDRIIKIKEGSEIEILTTENQLAVGLGKQIKRAFKAKIDVKWSKGESVARVIADLK